MKRIQLALVLMGICTIVGLVAFHYQSPQEIEFYVVIPTYNNEKYCLQNIQSVVGQSYPQWHAIIVNDCSSDATSALLHSYVQQHALQNKITIIDNAVRKGALQNLYETIQQCPDNAVVVTLDGDDWLASAHALKRIAKEYQNGTTWLTYGQYLCQPYEAASICRPIPEYVMQHRLFRTCEWVTSHPRTFYAWLFKKIKKEDLMHQGKFFAVTWDLAMMFPMLEMASNKHITFIPDILYIYNVSNPLNDFKCHLELQLQYAQLIRQKVKYMPL